MKARTVWCTSSCEAWTEEHLTSGCGRDDPPSCSRCGEPYRCSDCGFDLDADLKCQRDDMGAGHCPSKDREG